ncbi:MAG: hypothetical protein AAF687_05560 [Pseudomonadota bacterium]
MYQNNRTSLFGLMVAAMIAFGAAAPALAKPKAVDGEPEIVRDGQDTLGRDKYLQIFNLPEQKIEPWEMSIASAFWLLGGDGRVIPASKITVTCPISREGKVEYGCGIAGERTAEEYRAFDAARAFGMLPRPGDYRKLEKWYGKGGLFSGKPWAHYRRLEYTVSLPELTAPIVDLESGELINQELISTVVDLSSTRRLAYPARALRRDIGGLQTIQCQIQQDYSIICRQTAFNPSEHAGLFAPSAKRLFGIQKAKPELPDGTDTRGLRFETTARYAIN